MQADSGSSTVASSVGFTISSVLCCPANATVYYRPNARQIHSHFLRYLRYSNRHLLCVPIAKSSATVEIARDADVRAHSLSL